MQDLLNVIKNIWNKYKSQIILVLCLLVCGFFLIRSCENNLTNKRIYDNNVKALTEQMQTWKTKAGDLVAEKTVLEGDVKLLKQTNEELYEQVKKLKARPKEVVYVETEIINEVHDTTFVVDSTYVKKYFDFSDQWRTLTGFVEYNKPNLNLAFTKDITKADFTVAIRDSKVYVTSNNPHIVYNDIQGVVLPKTEPMFTIATGPSFSAGYGLINKNFDFYAGWSVIIGYNIKSFGRKK
jgi:uncharacterized protein YoxC